MILVPKINDSTYYLGVNDRTKELFESLWPLPKGVAYNSYLIKDEKNVLIDTVDICYSEVFFNKLEQALDGADLHYLIVDHVEPDHSGSIALLMDKYPTLKIVSNKKAINMIQGFYGLQDCFIDVNESSELPIGSRSLKFVFAPMVHWPEVMFTYDPKEKTLFSADCFGSFGTLDGGIIDSQLDISQFMDDVYRYYSNIVGKYGSFAQKAIKKMDGIEINTIAATHGPIWREHISEIVSVYDKMSKYEGEVGCVVAYGSMYSHTEGVAETIGRSLGTHGIKNVVLHNVSKSHPSYILADIFKYKGLILGSPTYNNDLYPSISTLMSMIEGRNIPNRLYACFGSCSWNGAALKKLVPFGETMKWENVSEPLEIKMSMNNEQEEKAWEIGKAMAEKLLQK